MAPRFVDPSPPGEVTVVVLAGGESRRFGSDKLGALLAGTTVLDRLVDALPATWRVVLVGPRRDLTRAAVEWVREEPPGGGPSAGILAGSACSTTDMTVVVAGDMPYAAAALPVLVKALAEAGEDVQAAVGVDDDGHANPLLAAYRTAALRQALPEPAHGTPAKRLLAMGHVTVPIGGRISRDVDTPGDLQAFTSGPLVDRPVDPPVDPPAGAPAGSSG
ncbi:MAG: NTP transferase domain-containing protein [Phycicoccus sp.]|nr:NTP transferase domain-containing protein [Phycicoccus sp.]